MAQTYMDLANIYSIIETDTKLAYEYHRKSIDLYEKLQDSTGLAKAQYNIIITAMEAEDYNKAYAHLIRAKKLVKHSQHASYEVALDNILGQYHLIKGNHKMADSYLHKALKAAKKDSLYPELEEVYYHIAENYYQTGKFEKAYQAKNLYEEYNLKNAENSRSLENDALSAKYQVAEYKKDAEAAEIQNTLQAEIMTSKEKLTTFLLIFSVAILSLFIFLYVLYRKRKELVKLLKHRNKAYLKAKNEAIKLSKAKSRFFSTVSHELRTPLYGVIGLSTILLENEKLKEHQDDLKSLKFSADYLLALINDLLQMNKIESGDSENKDKEFSIKELTGTIVESFEYMRKQNDNKIHIHISETIPQLIKGNSIRLAQILMNLIGNACKFTKNGDIFVIAETTTLDDKSVGIKFYIKDSGPGIPKDKQEHIFEEILANQCPRKPLSRNGTWPSYCKETIGFIGFGYHPKK